jgi:class 3 adenylate cyclase/tetratricopeptide (TPR) repeat protein
MQCPFCGTINPAQARFCMGCGAKLVQGNVCGVCQTLLPLQARYCYHCGSYVSSGDGAPIQPVTLSTNIQYPVAPAPVSITQPVSPSPIIQNVPLTMDSQPAIEHLLQPGETGLGSGREVPADVRNPVKTQSPVPRQLSEMLPSLQRYLPTNLYEPLERRPKDKDLVAVSDHLTALITTCKTYLPRPVVISPQPAGIPAGAMQRGIFLFGDVSGFTPLSEKLKVLGQAGAEQITSIINSLFTELVKVLFAHGGTLLKFGGDAMLGMWSAATSKEMTAAALSACQAGMAIQKVLSLPQFAEIDALGSKHTLSIKVGISGGSYFAAHIGTLPSENNLNGTMTFVTTGETVNQAEEAEEHAFPGQVSMTRYVADLLAGQAELAPVEREPDDNYRRLLSVPTLDADKGSRSDIQEPPEGSVDAQISYLVDRLDRLTPYLSDELISRIVSNPRNVRIQPEHRPVTVMFVNYKGISKLIEKHGESDPDLITQHLNNYFCKMASIVERYEGTLARMDQYSVGDRIVIFFGAPRAHEDDPVRAIYAALEMQEIVRKDFAALRTASGVFRFEQRVGVNTGHLFAGNAGAPDLRQEFTLMGDDINMAARLMSNAPWGQIYLSRRTRDQVAAFIDLEDRGEIKVKGKEIKIPTFAALGRSIKVGRTRGLDSGESPLTGRDDQLNSLLEHTRIFLTGRGQILSITGHSGLGKSRLLNELHSLIGKQPEMPTNILWVETRALSFSEQIGYWMAAQMMRSLLEIGSNATQDDVLYRLSERGEILLGDQAMDAIPYLAHMMGLELGEEWAWVKKIDPKARQKQTFWAAAELIKALAKERPLLIALDDLHWADEASLALFGHLLKVTDQAPVMFCLLFRPLREQGCWKLRDRAAAEYPHRYFEVILEPLNSVQSSELLLRLLPGAVFPEENRLDILNKATGNPFYLEEMVRTLMEAGAVIPDPEQPGGWKVTDRIRQMTIPVNLHAAIAARIDRLTEDARQALQMAAVIGRQFRVELLRNLAQAETEIDLWVSQLERGGLVSPSGLSIDPLYSFPDALVHEVAYESLLVLSRQQMHRQVGDLLESVYADKLEANCELLAFHYSRSDDRPKALKYLLMAAKKSDEKYATITVIEYYKKILQIQRDLGDLGGQAGALYQMGVKAYEMGDYGPAREWLLEASGLQRQIQDPKSEAWSVMYLGMIELKRADYPHAAEYHRSALENARQRQDSFQEGIHLTNLARVNMRLGQYELALEQFHQSLILKKSNNDIMGQGFALFYIGITCLYQDRDTEAEQFLTESMAMWQQVTLNERGLAFVEQGLGLLALFQHHYEKSAVSFRSAITRCEKLVLKAEMIENLSYLSQALLGMKDTEGARLASDQAIRLLEAQKDVEEEQHIYFNHYRVLLAAKNAAATDFLHQAEKIMHEQAERINDQEQRDIFLTCVPVNQEIGVACQG